MGRLERLEKQVEERNRRTAQAKASLAEAEDNARFLYEAETCSLEADTPTQKPWSETIDGLPRFVPRILKNILKDILID